MLTTLCSQQECQWIHKAIPNAYNTSNKTNVVESINLPFKCLVIVKLNVWLTLLILMIILTRWQNTQTIPLTNLTELANDRGEDILIELHSNYEHRLMLHW